MNKKRKEQQYEAKPSEKNYVMKKCTVKIESSNKILVSGNKKDIIKKISDAASLELKKIKINASTKISAVTVLVFVNRT